MWRQFVIPIILLANCLADRNNTTPGHITDNVADEVTLVYAKLRQDILHRPVAIHRIPPCIESHFQERYVLEMANLIVDVHKFDEINQVMTLQFYYGITWYHKALSWNPADYSNITNIFVSSSDIWTPNIEVNMGLEGSTTVDFSGDLQLAAKGAVTFMRLRLLSLSCDIDFYNYPFDSQTCSVGFYPHGPPEADPVFNENNFDLNKFYTVHKEWLITSKRNFINNLNDKITNINVAVPTHSITMNRKPLYYVITIIFPMVVTSVMIPLVFMIPTQTGEKISYLIALFTSTAIFLNFISDVMPRCLSNMPYLAVLLVEVLVESFVAMLIALLIVNIHAREELEAKRNKKAQASNADRILAKVKEVSEPHVSKPNSCSSILHGILFLSPQDPLLKKLDRVFFTLFTVAQVVFLLLLFLGSDWIRHSVTLSDEEAGTSSTTSS